MAWHSIMVNKLEQQQHPIYSHFSICSQLHIHICRFLLHSHPEIKQTFNSFRKCDHFDILLFLTIQSSKKQINHISKTNTYSGSQCSLSFTFGKQLLTGWIVNWWAGNILRGCFWLVHRYIFV